LRSSAWSRSWTAIELKLRGVFLSERYGP
jgi:hypothetical protein